MIAFRTAIFTLRTLHFTSTLMFMYDSQEQTAIVSLNITKGWSCLWRVKWEGNLNRCLFEFQASLGLFISRVSYMISSLVNNESVMVSKNVDCLATGVYKPRTTYRHIHQISYGDP